MSSFFDLYRERVFTYFKDQRFTNEINDAAFFGEKLGAACSDKICMAISLNGGVVEKVWVKVSGCMIATASANMWAEYAMGKSLKELSVLTEQKFIDDIVKIPVLSSRRECALLSFFLGSEGVEKLIKGQKGSV